MVTEKTDGLIRRWLVSKLPFHAPLDAEHWHYRFQCDRLEIYDYWSDTHALSDITADPETTFHVTWGCPHRDERLTAWIRELGSLSDIIAELEELEDNG